MYLVVGRHVIEFVEALQANAVMLSDVVHTLAGTNAVGMSLELFLGARLFLLEEDIVARVQLVVLVELVIAYQFTPRDVELLAERLKGVAAAYYDVIVLVELIYLVEIASSSIGRSV